MTKTCTMDLNAWRDELRNRVLNDFSETEFAETALGVYRFQATYNIVYKQFNQLLHRTPDQCKTLSHIPFIPVSMFKTHNLVCGDRAVASPTRFISSGTTGSVPSVHEILDVNLYHDSFLRGFSRVFGPPSAYHIFALLPSYIERGNSSLVYMVDKLMAAASSELGGFYLHNHTQLFNALTKALQSDRQTMLIGVTFALLDFIPALKHKLPGLILVETGGMKGRGNELVREELYRVLKEGFGINSVCSEYGMTELCSQGWSLDQGLYHPPPWMKVLIRDLNDPFHILEPGKRGGVNIIDLANLNSCSFIATDDLGVVHPDGSFEILGRRDGSEMRGCSLMVV